MTAYEINIEQLKVIARALGDLLPKVTFLGGCTTALLVDPAARFGVRQTQDVDVIIDVATYLAYQDISQQLRALGFVEDTQGPICRWLWRGDGRELLLDVMPTDESALGFSNIWYPDAMRLSQQVQLEPGLFIQAVSPVYFLATKFEAFAGRGKGDYFSQDMEDIVFVLENRSSIQHEINTADAGLRTYLANKAAETLNDRFLNVLPGLLNDSRAASEVEQLLRNLARQVD